MSVRARQHFFLALGGVFLPCVSPLISWLLYAVNASQPSEVPEERLWTRRLFQLAWLDTVVLLALGVTLSQHQTLEQLFLSPLPRPLSGIGVTLDREQASITSVAIGSPAEQAGLVAGDRVATCDGKPVSASAELRKCLGHHLPGETVELRLVRSHGEVTVSPVTKSTGELAKFPMPPSPENAARPARWSPEGLAPFAVLLVLGLYTWRRDKDRAALAVALGLAACTAVMQGLHLVVELTPLPQSAQFVLLAAASSLSLWATAALLDRFVLQGSAPKVLSGEPGWGRLAALGGWVQVTGSIRLAFLLFPFLLLTGRVGLPQMPVEQFVAPGQPLAAKFALFLVAAVLAPLAEERLFRGVLLTALMRTLSPLAALFASAVVFGTLHQGYGLRVALVVFLGMVFGQLRLSSGGLKASIALHMTWNAAISLVLFR